MSSGDAAHNGATSLIDTLLALGVTTMFGYPGGAILPIYDALYARPAPQPSEEALDNIAIQD